MSGKSTPADPFDRTRLPRAVRLIREAADTASDAADLLILHGADSSGLASLAQSLRDYAARVQGWERQR